MNWIKTISNEKAIILKNLSYLTVMKFFNIGFKFIIIGYLIRILGDTNYGLVTWVDSIIQYFIMIINFGFNVYIAKLIVENKKDRHKINEIVSSVYSVKAILFIGSLLIIYIISLSGKYNLYSEFLLLLMLTGLGEVLFPIWYFQGEENLKPPTIIVFFSRLIVILGIFLFVNTQQDTINYILLLVVSSWIMGFLGVFYMKKQHKVKLIKVPFRVIYGYAKESFPFFLGRFLLLVFNFGTIYLIGEYCSLEQVTGFDVSIKLIIVGVIPFEMIQQAVFPTISRTQNKDLLKKLVTSTFIIGLFIGLFIFIFAEPLLKLIGGDSMMAFKEHLKILSIMTPFIATTFILGTCSLVAFGYFKQYNISLISTSIIYISVLILFYFFDIMTFWNLIYLRVFGDVLMFSIRLYYSIKKKVLVFN